MHTVIQAHRTLTSKNLKQYMREQHPVTYDNHLRMWVCQFTNLRKEHREK